mmetsp:Transcript_14632/g.35709  ORF Transcript_14632/g.35709 Transcript_14632/m.35709 type:complete len:245 (-) Transcript_14632:89-823(-)
MTEPPDHAAPDLQQPHHDEDPPIGMKSKEPVTIQPDPAADEPETKGTSLRPDSDHNVSCCSIVQAPVQAFIRPGAWIPGCRNIRHHAEVWDISAHIGSAFEAFVSAVQHFQKESDGYMGREKIRIQKMDRKSYNASVFCFTAGAEWLDVVEIQFSKGKKGLLGQDNTAEMSCAIIRSFSSGFIPTIVPFGPLCSMAFFFVPFAGHDGKTGKFTNNERLRQIRERITSQGTEVIVVDETRGCSCL